MRAICQWATPNVESVADTERGRLRAAICLQERKGGYSGGAWPSLADGGYTRVLR